MWFRPSNILVILHILFPKIAKSTAIAAATLQGRSVCKCLLHHDQVLYFKFITIFNFVYSSTVDQFKTSISTMTISWLAVDCLSSRMSLRGPVGWEYYVWQRSCGFSLHHHGFGKWEQQLRSCGEDIKQWWVFILGVRKLTDLLEWAFQDLASDHNLRVRV